MSTADLYAVVLRFSCSWCEDAPLEGSPMPKDTAAARVSRARRHGATGPGAGRITRAMVLTAALEIIDRDGVEGLTMRRLGQALHRDPMVLYRSEEHTLNSSHPSISYAVFCLKKKKKQMI